MRGVFRGSDQPGTRRFDVTTASSASMATPATTTFTLPEQGVWEGTVASTYWGNPKAHFGVVKVKFVWYSADGVNYVRAGEVIGTGGYVGIVTGITVSTPDTAGAVTVSMTFSGGGNRDSRSYINLRQILAPADLNGFPTT